MTILQPSKANQQGDNDEPPPKKKLKKSKNSSRGPIVSHNVSQPGTSSAPGPSQRRSDTRDLYQYLATPSTFRLEPEATQFFETDHVIHKFQLDKFDVGIAPRSTAPAPLTYPEYPTAGPSHVVKAQINNPAYLEYYIYGPGSRSPNSKCRPLKRPSPDVDAIDVISSEEITPPAPVDPAPVIFDGISLLDDINNFDFDDKFGELEKFQQDTLWEDSKMQLVEKSKDEVASELTPQMNGYDKVTATAGSRSTRTSPSASLSNLGNTCFLNCVLYTLRFAPNFLHNLHHLVNDINLGSTEFIYKKTASLGRSASLMTRVKKDVYSGAGDLADARYPKTSKQIVTEKLHEVYHAMRRAEERGNSDPYHPEIFLTALREVNPIFEGNQQQDAHELLVCLLDIFRETCQAAVRHPSDPSPLYDTNSQGVGVGGARNSSFGKGNYGWFKKSWLKMKNKKNTNLNESSPHTLHTSDDLIPACDESGDPDAGQVFSDNPCEIADVTPPPTLPVSASCENFVAQDFEGVMVLRTTCLECENTTENKEPFADICVPIKTEPGDDNEDEGQNPGPLDDASELYKRAVVTDEFLRDRNKYYCEKCQRYNEARRSVRYHRLPRLLTMQLKRFSSTYGAMSKVTAYMPTPMTLTCFCEECLECASGAKHRYDLYGVIMHLGPNMAGGHYIAYVRAGDTTQGYAGCMRDWPKTAPSKPPLTFFSKTAGGGEAQNGLPSRKTCRALECCAIRSGGAAEASAFERGDTPWMACDDDLVKVLKATEVEALLSKHSTSNATPYLLFYVRRTD